MKVLMFGWEFPPHNSGGLGVACQGLSRALSETGVEVIFVLPKKVTTDESFRFVFADNVFITVRTVDALLTPYVTSEQYGSVVRQMGSSIYGNNLFEEVMRYAMRAKDIALKEEFDVIHAHDWLSFPAGIEAKRVTGKPLVVHVHATEFDRGGGGVNQDVYKVEKAGMEAADKVITVSDFTKNLVMEHYGIPAEKISVVHNGIESKDYPAKNEDDFGIEALKNAGYKIVLFVGRLTLQKGPDYFLYAAKRILEYNPKTMFVIAGSGDMEGKIMQMAAELNLSKNILFVGFLRGEALSRVYHSADVFVMPSVSEPFGITPLESLLHGTPVIMSKQSGASEVILHAMKMDFWDVDEMADKVLSVIEHPCLKQEMSKNGNKEVSSCSWDKAASKLHSVYKEVTS